MMRLWRTTKRNISTINNTFYRKAQPFQLLMQFSILKLPNQKPKQIKQKILSQQLVRKEMLPNKMKNLIDSKFMASSEMAMKLEFHQATLDN